MFCCAKKRVGLLLRQTCEGPELQLFVQYKICCNLCLATLGDPKEFRSLWGQLHDLSVILHQNKSWLYTCSLPPPTLRGVAVPTGRNPRHEGQRGGALWLNSWFGRTKDQDTAALCVLHNLGTAWRTTRQLGEGWSTHDSARYLLIPSSTAPWGREVTKFS